MYELRQFASTYDRRTDRVVGVGYNFIGNTTVNFCDCNFLASRSNVSWLDLLALEAITRLVYCLCGNHSENCSPAGNLLGGFTDLW